MHINKVKMGRHTRYQSLIIQNHQVLLIKHKRHSTGQAYWVIPGGGIDGTESEEECVIREMKEESNWDEDLIQDPFTYPTLVQLRKALGFKP